MQALAHSSPGAPCTCRPPGQGQVAVGSLDIGEQLVVRALRAVRAGSGGCAMLHEPLPALAPAVNAAVVRYACELRHDDAGSIAEVADPTCLTPAEACTLQAIRSMRAGLLGDAWKILAEICSPGRAGDALLALEEVAALRGPAGPAVHA